MADPKVSVLVTTFNQAKFIGQALDSFLAQETDFPFEIIVHDDCSTDGTTEIVRSYEERYPGKIRGMYEEENTYYTKGGRYFSRLMAPIAKGTYVAYCEGDDYWCDPHKLQRQHDFLESHPDYKSVTCCSRVIDGMTGEVVGRMGPLGGDREITFEEICLKWGTKTSEGLWNPPTAGMFTYREVSVAFWDEWRFATPVGDTASYLHAASKGKMFYLDEDMTVYRYQAEGSWTSYIRRDLSDKKYNWLLEWYEVCRIVMSYNIDEATDKHFHDAIEKDVKLHAYRLAYTVGPFEFKKTYDGRLGRYLTTTDLIKAGLVWAYIGVRRVIFHLGIEFVDSPFTGMRIQRARKLVDAEDKYKLEDWVRYKESFLNSEI